MGIFSEVDVHYYHVGITISLKLIESIIRLLHKERVLNSIETHEYYALTNLISP